MHKAQIRATFVYLKKVHDDSDRRFWFEFGNENSTTHFIDVWDGSNACIGLLEIRAAALRTIEDTVSRIVASFGPASGD